MSVFLFYAFPWVQADLGVSIRGDRRTCHANGKFFKFASASNIAAILHTPPGAPYPVARPSASKTFLKYAGFEAHAAIEAPATMMLKACAIVTMLGCAVGTVK